MRILFATKPHLPVPGGAQVTTHLLGTELRSRGHDVAMLALAPEAGYEPEPEAPHRSASSDRRLGYLTIRSPAPARELPSLLSSFAPDCLVVGGYHERTLGWAREMLGGAAHVPTVLYLHDADSTRLAGEVGLGIDRVAAVSRFLSEQVEGARGKVALIPPIVHRDRYRVRTSRRVALLVNPVPPKGVETVLALARARPDIPFAFTRCWRIPRRELLELRKTAARLGNVELRESVAAPASLYGDARVLLVPSLGPEAWGRVASEAQASGIPVIAAATGGIPEAMGGAGVLVEPDAPVGTWLRSLSEVWDDDAVYEREVTRAQEAAERDDISPGPVADNFEALARPLLH